MASQAADVSDRVAGVQNTFSSWDNCMSKTYCKWPVIVAIIIASLIAFSFIWCIARCLCCGMQCCCGCLSCCNACCPSPRGRREKKGYQQAPPIPYQYAQPPPMQNPYLVSGGAAGYGGGSRKDVAQTATFDAPSSQKVYNEDALPAMPSWQNASSRRIEQLEEDVELDKMDNQVVTSSVPAQSERLLNHQQKNPNSYNSNGQQAMESPPAAASMAGYRGQENGSTGDMGYMGAGGHAAQMDPYYRDYDQQQQQQRQQNTGGSPYHSSSQVGATGYYTGARTPQHDSPYGTHQNSYHNLAEPRSPSSVYEQQQQQQIQNPRNPTSYRSPMSGGYHTAGNPSPLSPYNNNPSPIGANNNSSNNDFYSSSGMQSSSRNNYTPTNHSPYYASHPTGPPSYMSTNDVVSPMSPPDILTPGGGGFGGGSGGMGRKPVQGGQF